MLNLDEIGRQAAEGEDVEQSFVKGRVLQLDADFPAYHCADIEESVNENFQNLKSYIEYKRKISQSEFVNLHLTLGMKGAREQIATVKPYQEQRSNRDPKVSERVRELRQLMANYKTKTINPVVNLYQEADDSLSQYQLTQIETGGMNSSILMSGDKDLWMVDGLHCDPNTGEIYKVEGYGKTKYEDVGNTKPKLIGRGKSWFWHQMLMGDKADNIPGLPKLSGELMNEYFPTKKFNPHRKAGQCGEAKAYGILKDVHSCGVAAQVVKLCYEEYYGEDGMAMLFEQAFLLWMRRTNKILDVLDYLKECGIPYKPNKQQVEALLRYKELAELQRKASNLE